MSKRFFYVASGVTAAVLTFAACGAPPAVNGIPALGSAANAVGPASHAHVIYDFQGGSDGASPQGPLLADGSGDFYGTTTFGGIYGCTFNAGCGTVYKLTPNGRGYTHTVLYAFQGGSDGEGPASGVVADTHGNLFGTTEFGDAAGYGTVFELVRSGSSYKEIVLHRFDGLDGDGPLAGLTIDSAGNLYGATLLGGNGGSGCSTSAGCGVLFELQHSGSTYTERTLHSFSGGRDGATPGSPPLFIGRNLYGTTATGGGNPSCGSAPLNRGCGTVYELIPHGSGYAFRVRYHFGGPPNDAANAFAGLTAGKHGILYGVGQYGGTANVGAVFELTRSHNRYSERVLHSFTGGRDGSYPLAALTPGADGHLYSVAEYGGASNDGTIYEVNPSGGERVLFSFPNGAGGAYPAGGLTLFAGKLYGTASYGGSASIAAGIAFRI